MRILLCVHQFFPDHTLGTERYTLGLARALMRCGHQVQVYTSADLPQSGEFLAAYEYDGIPVKAVNSIVSPKGKFQDYHTRPDLLPLHRQVIEDFQPELVHITHLLGLGMEVMTACEEAQVPVVMTFTDLWSFCWAGQCIRPCDTQLCRGPDADALNCTLDYLGSGPRRRLPVLEKVLAASGRIGLARPVFNLIRQLPEATQDRLAPDVRAVSTRNATITAGLDSIAHVFFPSHYLQDAFAENGMKFPTASVLPYGIRQPCTEERELLRQPRKGPPVFAFLGQLSRHKGLHILLEAFRMAAIPGAQLTIRGRYNDGDPNAAALKADIEATPGASYDGFFHGDETFHVLAGCDAVVIPSLWHENAPLSLLEALSAGKPAIISDGRGMVEFVKDGETGLITKMGSATSLRDALLRFQELGGRLPGIGPDRPGYTLSPEEHAAIIFEQHYGRLARPYTESPKLITGKLDLSRFIKMSPVLNPSEVVKSSEVAWSLAQARLRGCELRLPSPDLEFPAAPKASEYTPPLRGNSRYGKSFPKRFPPTLQLRVQNKPYFSIWGQKTREAQLHRIVGFETADFLDLTARAKLTRRSKLVVRGMLAQEDGPPREVVAHWTWNWPTRGWTRLRLNLAKLRSSGLQDLRVNWELISTREAWKIDLLEVSLGTTGAPRKTTPAMGVDCSRPHLISWPTIRDLHGDLTVAEFPSTLPFHPQRVYWIHGIPAHAKRGGHAHREVDEIAVPVNGAFTVTLQSPTRERQEFRLDRPDTGLYLPHGWWREIHSYAPNTVCLVVSSGPYNEQEYMRNPEQFFTT